MNVVFNAIEVRQGGKVKRYNWYIATRGARIRVILKQGSFHTCTEESSFEVENVHTTEHAREFGAIFAPALAIKAEPVEVGAEAGSVSAKFNKSRETSTKFVTKEHTLVPSLAGNTITWTINQALGEKAVREFLIGNLPLFAVFSWTGPIKTGRVRLTPEDVDFFNAKRRALGPVRSQLMRFAMWKKGIKIQNPDGFSISFREGEK